MLYFRILIMGDYEDHEETTGCLGPVFLILVIIIFAIIKYF